MKNLKYLVPRCGLLAVMALGIWVSSGLLTRAIVNQSPLLTPFQLSVDRADVDWEQASVTLRNLKLAAPKSDDGTASAQGIDGSDTSVVGFVADKAVLKLDPQALLEQRWVVTDGMVTNPRVGGQMSAHPLTPTRGLSARLAEAFQAANAHTNDYLARPKLSIEPTWWQQVQRADGLANSPGGHTLEAIVSYRQIWEQQLTQYRNDIAKLGEEIASAKAKANKPFNPLRSDSQLEATQQVNHLSERILELQRKVESLQSTADQQLQALTDTARGEIELLERTLRLPQPPAVSFDQDFASRQSWEPIEQVFAWAEWASSVVPSLEPQTNETRGRTLEIDSKPLPNLEIQKLTLVGVTDVGGQYYRLMGSLQNLSNSAYAQRQPTSLSLRAQGDNHLMVSGLYDRRNGNNKSHFSVKSLDLKTPSELTLASGPESRIGLPLAISPSSYVAQLQMNLDGDQLEGKLTVRHSNLQVRCDTTGLRNHRLSEQLANRLSEIESFEVTYDLRGTLDKIVAKPQSDLGWQIATALGETTQNHFAGLVAEQAESVARSIQEQRGALDQWIDSQARELLAGIQVEKQAVADLSGSFENRGDRRLR